MEGTTAKTKKRMKHKQPLVDNVEIGGIASPWEKSSVLPNTHPAGFLAFRCYLRAPSESIPSSDEESQEEPREEEKDERYKDFEWADLPYSLFQGEETLTDIEKNHFLHAVVSAGQVSYVVDKVDLPDFILAHKDRIFICHEVAVDFYLVKCLLERLGREDSLQWWWELVNNGRVRDISLLHSLTRLGLDDENPEPWPLRDICIAWLGQDSFPFKGGGNDGVQVLNIGQRFYQQNQEGEGTGERVAALDVTLMVKVYGIILVQALAVMKRYATDAYPDAWEKYGALSEGIQVKAAIALASITMNGMAVDREGAEKLRDGLQQKLIWATNKLMQDPDCEGLFHNNTALEAPPAEEAKQVTVKRPSMARTKLNEILLDVKREASKFLSEPITVPKTEKTGQYSLSSKVWNRYADYSPFIKHWIDMENASHYCSFLDHVKGRDVVRPRYTVIVRNGRATCGNPPIQQTPRSGGYRELFKASPGHLLLAVDYDFIELCTLGAVCEARYGTSVLANVIRGGVDPHSFTAAMFEGVSLPEFMSWKHHSDPAIKAKFASLRQRAKAINFGIPGGLSAGGLADYAKSAYNVYLSCYEAGQFRKRLVNEVYPELSLYLTDFEVETLARNLGCQLWKLKNRFGLVKAPGLIIGIRNIVAGKIGKKVNKNWHIRVWTSLKALCTKPRVLEAIIQYENVGHERLARMLFGRPVSTLTGRVRGSVGFTQACNTPFSGLAADGAKLAMFNLLQVGYRLIGFIHDEILVEIKEDSDWTREAQIVEQIFVESMQELTGTIPISCSFALSRYWSKKAEAVYDEKGKLLVWEDPAVVAAASSNKEE